jgi:hypothetical protein
VDDDDDDDDDEVRVVVVVDSWLHGTMGVDDDEWFHS